MEFVWGLRVGISIFRYDWNLFAVHAQVSFFTHLCLGSTRKYHLTYSGWVGKVCMQGPLLREGWAGARARESKSPPQSSHEYMCIYIYIYIHIYIYSFCCLLPTTHPLLPRHHITFGLEFGQLLKSILHETRKVVGCIVYWKHEYIRNLLWGGGGRRRAPTNLGDAFKKFLENVEYGINKYLYRAEEHELAIC